MYHECNMVALVLALAVLIFQSKFLHIMLTNS